MLQLLSDRGIPLYAGSPEEAVQEMDTGAKWLKSVR
jgi:hypothetical protein